jgi:hypothetical protein
VDLYLYTPVWDLGAAGFVFAIKLARNQGHKKVNEIISRARTHTHTHTYKYRVGQGREGGVLP